MSETRSTREPVSRGNQGRGRRSMGKEQKKLDLTMQLSDRDPQLAHKDHGTDSRHHAISDMPSQLQSEETGHLDRSKSAKGNDKESKITPAVRLSTGTRRKVTASSKGGSSAATASKHRSSNLNQHASQDADDNPTKILDQSIPSGTGTKLQRLKLTMPRKAKARTQRSSQTKYTLHLTTEVDWNEDLRPTDDDEALATINDKLEGHDAGTSVSTPDPELTSDGEHEIKTKQKRKVSKTQTVSEKRRKVSRAKSSSGTKNKRQPQLPLTAVSSAGYSRASAPMPSKPSPSNLRSHARSSNGQLTNASAHNRTTSTGPPSGNDTINLKDTASQQREVIVISSSPAPSSFSNSDSGIDALQSEAYRYRVIGVGSTGRGKSVGQKLRDALHGVELHTQLRPAIETSLQSINKDLDGISHEKVPSPSSRMRSTTESPNQNSQGHLNIQQNLEVAPMLEAQSQTEPLPIQDTKSQGEDVHQDEPDNEKMMTCPKGLREESSSPEASIRREYSSDETHDESETKSLHAVNPGASKAADALEYSQASIGSLQNPVNNESDTSSQDSSEPEINGFANGYPRNEQNKNNQTPDSQQPLLTRQTTLQLPSEVSGPARTALRSSIVDANGSPRLFEDESLITDQTRSPLKEVRNPSEAQIPQPSSSVYDQNSDERSLHSSDDELTWSKYQREMFLEYGFETESMKKKPQSAHPRDRAGEEGSGITTSQRMPMQPEPTISYNPLLSASITTGPGADRAGPGQNSAMTNSDRSDRDQPGLHTGQHAVVPLSTQVQVSGGQQLSQSSENSPPDWIAALQTAQKQAHDLLQETNQSLSSQLAAEQETIQRVLQIYRQGCNRVLDDLSQAQRVRMDLYQQQMASVREQHREICQDLIRGIQELDDRVQEGP